MAVIVPALVLALLSQPTAFDRLREKVPVEHIAADADLSGRYAFSWLLEGMDLYLFRDGTYALSFETDVACASISDRGRWSRAGDVIRLASAPEVTWELYAWEAAREYVAARNVVGGAEYLVLIDTGLDLSRLGGPDGGLTLRRHGFTLLETWEKGSDTERKARLMREQWRPETVSKGRRTRAQ